MGTQRPLLRTGSISFSEYPLEEVCRKAAEAGFDGLEIWKPQLAKCKTSELLKQFTHYASKLGIRVCALNDVDAEFFRPFDSEYSFNATVAGLKSNVDLAQTLDVTDVLAWEGIRPRVWTKDQDELLRIVTNLYRQVTGYSSKRGIRFLVEPHPFSLGMDLDFLKRLCDSLDGRYFGVLYDSCHFGVGRAKDYVDSIRVLGKRIKHIHFADSDQMTSELHFPLGKGRLDLDAIIGAFVEVGFRGTISLDTYGYPLPEEAARQGLPILKKSIRKLGLD